MKKKKEKKGQISLKRIIKNEQVSLKLKDREIHSVLRDKNRFFKDELEETKRSMFL